jgi:acetyl-CoA carboxylase biotin carboxyl carrier protein
MKPQELDTLDSAGLADLAGRLQGWQQATDIGLLELRGPGVFIRLQAPAGAQASAAHVAASEALQQPARTVRAGSVGVLRLSHPLRAQPLVQRGQTVSAGQTLALLQIGAVLLPVGAPCAGTLGQWLTQDGVVVGYGQALIDMEEEARDAD